VRVTLQRYLGAFHLSRPKTEKSTRSISLPPRVVAALRHLRKQQLDAQQEMASLGLTWADEWGLCFTDGMGQPLQPYIVTAAFASLLSNAGLRHVRFHDLRHGVATFLLQQGVAMKVVQDVLGHSTITMTMDRYSHVVPELRHDAAEKVGAVLFG